METSSRPLMVVDSHDVYSDLQTTLRVKHVKNLCCKARPDDQTHYLLLYILLLLKQEKEV